MAKDEELLRATIAAGVELAFERIGVTTKDPIEVQKDFAWLRRSRIRCESLANRVWAWVVVAVLSLGAALSYDGLLHRLRGD